MSFSPILCDNKSMRLSFLIDNYQPVYPEPYNWDSTVAYMMSDPTEKKTVLLLLAVLEKEGKFREPVSLGTAEFDEDVEVFAVVNGTHRVVAHILHGDPEAEVFTLREEDRPEYDWENDTSTGLSTSFLFAQPLDDELFFDRLFGLLRSFPVTEELWMTSDVTSSRLEHYESMWDITNPTEEQVQLVHDTVLRLIEEDKFPIPYLEVHTFVTKADGAVLHGVKTLTEEPSESVVAELG